MATSQLSQTAVGEALLSIALLPKRSQLTTSQTRTVVPGGIVPWISSADRKAVRRAGRDEERRHSPVGNAARRVGAGSRCAAPGSIERRLTAFPNFLNIWSCPGEHH